MQQTALVKPLDETHAWRAVLARDAAADGRFVFAVRSTGIYCRPSCPARRPRRAQVMFFSAPEAAERAGFRPCRRCHPEQPRRATADLVQRVCRALENNGEDRMTLARLSAELGVSPYHLQRSFKRALGITPRQYAEARRLRALKAGLQKGDDVTTALYAAGYGSSSRLYERAQAQLGMTPGTYRRGGQGVRINYATTRSPLGRLLVAATARGLCFVSLGDSDARLEAALWREYPKAEIRRNANGLSRWVRTLVNHLRGRQPRLDLPLDVQATAFERRVWEALRAIPYGATRSYSQVARALGNPKATRAVARACARNPVSVVVPCHRVVRKDGDLGGYRWGLARKQALLAQERTGTGRGLSREGTSRQR